MLTIRELGRYATLVVTPGLVLACSDSIGITGSGPTIVTLRGNAPALETAVTTFYAKKGTDREARIYFTDGAGGRGSEYIRLEVGANALLARPDGSAIATGDSILITIRVVDTKRILFELLPDGLRFAPNAQARLVAHYIEADKDFDGDGDEDANDAAIESRLAIWRQPTASLDFQKLPSTLVLDMDGIISHLPGFSRYAIAY